MSSLSQRVGGSQAARRRDAPAPTVLIIVCAGVVLASLDLFIVNVALPEIARGLHERSLASLSWVLDAYAIVYAALLVLFGRIAERFPREEGFLLGVLIFTVASAACGLAPTLGWLIGFRVLQAVGGALMTPTSVGLILATAPPERRAGSVRAWAAIGGAAAALGPVVGGFLVAAGWRWVFFVNVPIGLVALFVGWRRLPRVPGHAVPAPDALGAGLVTAGIGLVTLGLVEGNAWGWGSGRVLGALSAGVALVVGFVVHTRLSANPLVPPGLFGVRRFSGASMVALWFSVAFGAMLLSVVLWMQQVWGWSALHTGLAFAPGPLLVPIVSFGVAGRLIARWGPGRVIGVGAVVYACGAAWWAWRTGLRPSYAGEVLPGTLLTGIGVGLTLPTFISAGSAALPPSAFATGSAVINMLRQVGLAVGVAVFVAVLGTPHDGAGEVHGFHAAWAVIAGFSALSAVLGVVGLGLERGGAPGVVAAPAAAGAGPLRP